jgi:Transposase DDE domain
MAQPRRLPVREADLGGFKYFQMLMPLLERLHEGGTARDKAGNRQFFFDQYALLLLLYFFNPVITSLRALQQASGLDKAQRLLGIRRVSLGSLSEATEVFDAQALRQIVQELAERALPLEHGASAEALRGLTAVDGTILPALPKMLWALWKDAEHRAVKVHLHFEVFKSVPCDARVTPAACSEPAHLQAMLQPGRLYVIDRGYASYELFQAILKAGSSFVGRVLDTTSFALKEDRPLTDADRAAGVIRDALMFRLGIAYGVTSFYEALRLIVVRRLKPDHTVEELWLVTNRLDLPAELIALAYRYRWTVELFFRWFKCILGCRHLLCQDANGVAIQCYVALIASLLVVLWTGRKPTRRTWEMIQFYLMGWATLEEVQTHLETLKAREKKPA